MEGTVELKDGRERVKGNREMGDQKARKTGKGMIR